MTAQDHRSAGARPAATAISARGTFFPCFRVPFTHFPQVGTCARGELQKGQRKTCTGTSTGKTGDFGLTWMAQFWKVVVDPWQRWPAFDLAASEPARQRDRRARLTAGVLMHRSQEPLPTGCTRDQDHQIGSQAHDWPRPASLPLAGDPVQSRGMTFCPSVAKESPLARRLMVVQLPGWYSHFPKKCGALRKGRIDDNKRASVQKPCTGSPIVTCLKAAVEPENSDYPELNLNGKRRPLPNQYMTRNHGGRLISW